MFGDDVRMVWAGIPGLVIVKGVGEVVMGEVIIIPPGDVLLNVGDVIRPPSPFCGNSTPGN